MKLDHYYITTLLVFSSFFVCSQEKNKEKLKIDVNWVSEFHFDSIEFITGDFFWLTQQCTKKVPETLSNETVKFDNFYVGKYKFTFFVSFKDTIIKQGIYIYEGKQQEEVLNLFKLDKSQFEPVGKKQAVYFTDKNGINIACWMDKKRIVYQEVSVK